jgi:spermidine/putrescine transport system ATP-binding protein
MNVLDCRIGSGADGFAQVETAVGGFRAANPNGLRAGETATLFLRPERLRLLAPGEAAENRIAARVVRRDMEGAWSTLVVETGGREMKLHLPHGGQETPPSGEVALGFASAEATILPKGEMSDD